MNLVMFDIDGTLCRTEGADELCFVRAVGEVAGLWRLEDDWSRYRNVTEPGIAGQVIAQSLGRPATPKELQQIRDRFLVLLQEHAASKPTSFSEVPGAGAMLQALARTGKVAVALATGGWMETAQFKLAAAGITTAFPMASGNDAIAREEILRLSEERAAAHYGAPRFCSITYVGDGVWDLIAAKSLGCHFVGVAAGGRAEKLKQHGASQVVRDFADLDSFWKALNKD